jgi:predicted peptidase
VRAAILATLIIALSFVPFTAKCDEPAAGKQVETKIDLGGGQSIETLLYLPDAYDGNAKVPLLLFLHGRGESYGPLSRVKQWGPPKLIDAGREFKYIVVSPQCPKESFWSRDDQQQKLEKLLEHLIANHAVDTRRIYLTGLSMGGFGSWTLAANHPKMFAAVVPICGRGDPADADTLKNIPIWAWHGVDDAVVKYSNSETIVKAIVDAGGTKARLTSLEGIGHNSWSAAYHSPDLYDWLDKQRLPE